MSVPVLSPAAKSRVFESGPVKLIVVSEDQQVLKLCQEVLRELIGSSTDGTGSSKDRVSDVEIWLWDFEPDAEAALPEPSSDRKIFYLVHPSQLEILRKQMPESDGHILLKPVTRAVLRSFLGSVNPAGSAGNVDSAEIHKLRANRDEIFQRLLQANLRLQEYDQQRTNFIARAVHDFRAPLTALSGFCGLLLGKELGPLNEQQTEALERMQHSVKRIARMASAMFDLSISPQVNRQPDLRDGDIREPVQQALHEITPITREKQIALTADIAEPAAPLSFEPAQIEQVLLNLLDNACKFTQRGGSIEVRGYPYFWERRFLSNGGSGVERRRSLSNTPNAYRVEIRDSGVGIPPERLHRIFEEYTSYSGPQDRSGGGLGLAICRLIMNRHQGAVWAESEGKGSVFSFVLPHRRLQPQGNIPSLPNSSL